MSKSEIVTNSTPIIGLSILGQLHLLAELFEQVYVPTAVYQEIVHSDSPRQYGKKELERLVSRGIFTLYNVDNSVMVKKLYGKLHEGELEVIVGAKELDLQFVAIDEHAARTLTKTFLLKPIGTIGILILAKKLNKIEKVKPFLDTLLSNGFHISKKLYQQALVQAGEL
ncbi:DUF3368 domain-containing protein [Sporosarcina sp. E16_8]|uniref:DUF3368 domain-containing protein n=1 Tax=Sporosarcina sp. E16_8 TaxID=2789295 RepID=UPI001A9123F5|nr:DUF3368 domain-containing protein [Sporosarcina sp. E16_8]MBO0589494.1 DUF3368 domain-containing protein [Sporosarcina sp. E16_8]